MIPAELAEVLRRNRITTAEKLMTTSAELPGALAELVGWSVGDVQQARAGLVPLLRGHVEADLLEEGSTPPRFSFGAFPPR